MEPFLLIGNNPLPHPGNDSYQCPEVQLSVSLDMISGRRVIEGRGLVYQPSVTYDYLEDSVLRPVLDVLRSGAPFIATVLPDNSDETVTTSFVLESMTNPTVLTFDGTEPIWHGLAFTLREEEPHGGAIQPMYLRRVKRNNRLLKLRVISPPQ